MTIEHKEAKKGYFSASRISDLLAGGTGKTRQSYILDVCLDMLGLKKEFGNAFTEHGINNEIHAFNDVVIKQFPNALLQSDVFITINKNLGASPDVVFSNNNDALDIKCPTLLKFHHYKWNTLKSYYDQLQTQLLATKGDTAYLLFYLTKPITWDNADNWKEYEFENENDNFFIKSFPKDEKRQEEILDAVEKAVPIRDEMFYKLLTAPIYDFKYLMNYASTGGGYASIKESSNILKSNIFRYENEFYYFKNK
jgi:hypothetical protein